MSISTFIIVKNEAATLMRTLESAGRFSDEIIIGIDDTTTDSTVDVISEFLPSFNGEVEIFEFMWNDSFAEARNNAIARCNCDWIFQLDGHEFLRPGDEEKIKELLNVIPEDIRLVAIEMWDEWVDGQPNSRFFQDHLWRNDFEVIYDGAMHNYISTESCPTEFRIKTPEIVIFHQRTKENAKIRKIQRLEMAEKVFLPEIEKNPGDLRSLFYLAQSYLNSELYDQAEVYYRKYIEASENQGIPSESEQSWAYYKLGMISIAKEKFDLAVENFFKGLEYRADSPEIWLGLGEVFLLMDKPREAERFLLTAGNTAPEEDHLFRYGLAITHGPWLRLMQLHYSQGNYAKAFRAGMIGLQKKPENGDLLEGVRASLSAAALRIKVPDSKKKNLYVVDATGQFTTRLVEDWKKSHNVIVHERLDLAHMAWADVAFVEWADRNLFEAALHKFRCHLITRIHRYEVYQNLFKEINWKNVHLAVFTSKYIREKAGELPCRTAIIENKIDPEQYRPLESYNRWNLCYVGYIHKRKNLGFLIDLLNASDKRFKLHIAGDFQDEEYQDFILNQIESLKMQNRVIFHGWQVDINSWFDDIKPVSILSVSTSEGLPYSILEAEAKGIVPLVYSYPGVKDQFKEDFIFSSSLEFKAKLKKLKEMGEPGRLVIPHQRRDEELSAFRSVLAEMEERSDKKSKN
ncbi:MAG: glycosyltransferase [Acidobacteria bacterium]|nr:glycosyltransferase [Acidobacteriota bacterium]